MLSRNVSVKVEQTLGGLERCVTHTLSLKKSPKSSVSHTLCVLRKVCHTLCDIRKVLLPCVSQNKYVAHCVSHFAVISQLSWLHVTMQAPQTTSFLALRMWGQRSEGWGGTTYIFVLCAITEGLCHRRPGSTIFNCKDPTDNVWCVTIPTMCHHPPAHLRMCCHGGLACQWGLDQVFVAQSLGGEELTNTCNGWSIRWWKQRVLFHPSAPILRIHVDQKYW